MSFPPVAQLSFNDRSCFNGSCLETPSIYRRKMEETPIRNVEK